MLTESSVPRRNHARLGPRLRGLIELCPTEGTVADVGSGHGGVALALSRRNPSRRVFATEASPGPAAELRRLVDPASGVVILVGPGLRPLRGLGCSGAVLAGMGGETIWRILEAERELCQRLEWLLLQPAQRSERLASWLDREGWRVLRAGAPEERSRRYPTFLVAPA